MTSSGDKSSKSTEKQKRLSEALRANLRRRKDQSRGRKQVGAVTDHNKTKNQD